MSHEDELQYRAGCDDPEDKGSDTVYGPPVTCGHQLTEAETEYYQKYPYRDRLCKRCTMEERAR